ncbi:hypothetical protein Bbelb_035600 [Branchiostoma belcheri]|nr:hypothetical protein Bbelb_035600 [Branchiostoma belcheri]
MHLLVDFATEANATLKVFEDAVSEGSGAARLIRTACSAFTDHGNENGPTRRGNFSRKTVIGADQQETWGGRSWRCNKGKERGHDVLRTSAVEPRGPASGADRPCDVTTTPWSRKEGVVMCS